MKKIMLFVVILLFLMISKTYARDNIKVFVWTLGNEKIDGEVATYIERELRSLGDIEVVNNIDSPRDFSISVTPTLIHYEDSSSEAIAITWVYIANIAKSLDRNVLPHVNPEWQDYAKKQWQFAGITTHNPQMRIVEYTDLEKICKEIVLRFDELVLKKERQRREGTKNP